MMIDETGIALDQMETPDGMLHAAHLAGETIAAPGFDMTSAIPDGAVSTDIFT